MNCGCQIQRSSLSYIDPFCWLQDFFFLNKKFRLNFKNYWEKQAWKKSLDPFEGKPVVEVVPIVSFQADCKLVLLQTGMLSQELDVYRTVLRRILVTWKAFVF